MNFSQLQQEAREGFARTRSMSVDDITSIDGRFLDRLTARVYAAALDAVESGLEMIESDPPNDTIDTTTGFHQATEEMLSHLRTLREGITGNEHAK